MNWWDNREMKRYEGERHPGPFRVMRVDAESAGILVAVAFLVLGLVGLPIARWFFLGALPSVRPLLVVASLCSTGS
jgi:hypothetical protein